MNGDRRWNKWLLITALLGVGVFFAMAVGSAVQAAALDYVPISDVPGLENQSQTFPQYIRNIFLAFIWLVGISSLVMIAIGGFWYMTSAGNTARAGTAKDMITDALVGMILALACWIILNTINPDLTKINLTSLSSSGISSTNTNTSGNSVPPTTGAQGNCGGIKTSGAAPGQCELVSAPLNSLLDCMAKNGANEGGSVYSITASTVGNDLEKSKACCGSKDRKQCPHAAGTCHHGCGMSDQGYSHAVDYTTAANASDQTLCNIAEIAWKCGAGATVWGPRSITCPSGGKITEKEKHETHLHIADAQCNH